MRHAGGAVAVIAIGSGRQISGDYSIHTGNRWFTLVILLYITITRRAQADAFTKLCEWMTQYTHSNQALLLNPPSLLRPLRRIIFGFTIATSCIATMRVGLFFLVSAHASLLAVDAATIPSVDAGDVQTANTDQTPLTCRWSNCNEQCAPGYVPVPRQGGKRDEMIWDHTHCQGVGMQLFCCPSEISQPVCRWRGHKNSGHCSPGCQRGEAEVGTLRFGCKTEHQSACCSLGIGTVAYGSCKWHGTAPLCSRGMMPGEPSHAPCSKEYPDFVFATSAGFGGEKTCDSGK